MIPHGYLAYNGYGAVYLLFVQNGHVFFNNPLFFQSTDSLVNRGGGKIEDCSDFLGRFFGNFLIVLIQG